MGFWSLRPGWDPFSELQRQVERLFDVTVDAGRQTWHAMRQFPAFNLYETAGEYVLATPLPGAKTEDLDITITGQSITLKGERKRNGVPDEAYRRQERWLGKWSRTIQAPDKADLSQINASLDNGLLVLRMPKAPESQPRQVAVKSAQNS